MSKKRVVILGGGFAGAYCAQEMERALVKSQVEVTLVNEHNYFIFHPLLTEAGTGSLEPRHAVVSIRSFLKTTAFLMGRVTGINLETKQVSLFFPETEETRSIAYDHLVLALGSVTRMLEIPGLKERAYTIKNLSDAVALRDRAIQMLEVASATEDPDLKKSLLHFVVVGASYTGVEVAGEFDYFFKQAARLYKNLSPRNCRVSLIEVTGRILPALDKNLADYACRQLEKRGVRIYLNTSVSEIRKNQVILKEGEPLAARTVIWAAGIAPNPLLEHLELPKDDGGYILCERDLRVQGQQTLWAIGDCAVNPDKNGDPYPATAQHAVQQGKFLAKNLTRVLKGESPQPCTIQTRGTLAALGCRTGVARVMGIRLSGLTAWILWRTVYLMKMPTLSRKLRVALDWTTDFLFSRDFVELGVHKGRPVKEKGED